MNQQFTVDKLKVSVFSSRAEMACTAAKETAQYLRELLAQQEKVFVIFASAPSQADYLAALIGEENIDWKRVHAFHMDEYVGIPQTDSHSFGNFLEKNVFEHVPISHIEYLRGDTDDIAAECERYSELLRQQPIDIVLMGIGENGHIAFNDPPVADFHDKALVKLVELDEICRTQQVNDKCFPTLNDVPKTAMTLTVPMLMSAKRAFCMVPTVAKANAVKDTLTGEISEKCPASILRTHDNASLYLEPDSYSVTASFK